MSVVVPAYNESTRLAETLSHLHAFLHTGSYDAEIIVVDDGSIDDTPVIARDFARAHASVRVISYPRNKGKGHAVRTGVLDATREAILFCDADHSTPIAEIDRLWPFLERGYEVVIGTRYGRGERERVTRSIPRYCVGKLFQLVISTLGVRGFHDTQCGFKLFSRAAARQLFQPARTNGFAFDVEILLHARKENYRIAQVPVVWREMMASKVRPARDGLRMLLEVLRMRGLL